MLGIPRICHQHHQQCWCQNFKAGVKKCELVCFLVKIKNFVFFSVKKSRISVFLVSVENGGEISRCNHFPFHFIGVCLCSQTCLHLSFHLLCSLVSNIIHLPSLVELMELSLLQSTPVPSHLSVSVF